jgi:O-antigen/teichoic acid export membrane protein
MLARGIVITLLVGRALGGEALGIWSVALATVIVPLWAIAGPVGRLLYATFARMQGQVERVGALWLNGMGLLAAILLPALLGLLATAPDVIPLLFGQQWEPAVPIIQILVFSAAFNTLQAWSIAVVDASGKPHIALVFNGIGVGINVISVWIGSHWGLEGVAVAYVLGYLVFSEIPLLMVTLREIAVSPGDVFRRLWGVVLASVLMCVAMWLTRIGLEAGGIGPVVRVVVACVSGLVVYAAALRLLAPGIFAQLSSIVARRRAAAPAH